MRRLTAAFVCAVALGPSGCGGDEEDAERDTSVPIPTVPDSKRAETESRTVETQPSAPAPQPAPTPAPAPQEPSGGAVAPAPAAPTPDSPDNDIPPPEGSPAERFEQFCDESPGACGE